MRERRGQLFNKGRFGLLSPAKVQETLTEIVRQEFNNLTTADKSEVVSSTNRFMNYSLEQDDIVIEESEIIAEQGLFLIFLLF